MNKSNHLAVVATVLIGIASPLLAYAASSTGISPLCAVDTRVGGIVVSGRVLDAASRAPMSGATVTLAGQSTISSGAGLFSFVSVLLSSGNTLTVSKAGHATYTGTVPAPAGATAVTMPDILLQPAPVGSKPVVTRVEPRLKGLFLSGVTLNNDFTASVNWNGLTPGSVRFSVNGTQVASLTGSGPEYVASLNMGATPFQPSLNVFGNQITVQAVPASGQISDAFNVFVGISPMPDPLKFLTTQGWPFTTYLDGHLALDYDFPNPAIKTVVTFPVIGRFGFEVAGNASFDYTVTDGDWEAALGVGAEGKQGKRGRRPSLSGLLRSPKMKLYVGDKEISGLIEAGARGTATRQNGITFNEIFGHGEIQAKLELGRVGLADLIGPGLSSTVASVPGLGDLTKAVSVIIYIIPAVEGEITFATQPQFTFDTLELTGKVGLEAAYEPNLTKNITLRVYVGGEPSVTFGVPGDLFKNVKFRAYAGAEFQAWFLRLGPVEYVFVDVAYPASGSSLTMASAPSIAMLRVASPDTETVSPISRGYLADGPEQFLAFGAGATLSGAPLSTLATTTTTFHWTRSGSLEGRRNQERSLNRSWGRGHPCPHNLAAERRRI